MLLYEFHHHKVAYFILVCILVFHILLYLYLWPNMAMLRVLSASLAASYFFWGVFAHVKSNHITKKIVKEYFFAALLGGTILFLLTI